VLLNVFIGNIFVEGHLGGWVVERDRNVKRIEKGEIIKKKQNRTHREKNTKEEKSQTQINNKKQW
jgi:hypothetical protein